jgi:S1-C subfamily serine protease
MTEHGDHHDAPRPSADPAWGPPKGTPYLGSFPAGPADDDDWTSRPKRPGRWARAALVLGAAAVGFAVAVPTAALLRDGSGPINAPVAPQVSIAPENGADGPALPDLYRGLVDIDTRLAYEAGRAAGTGMVVTADGQVLTNAHVIDGAASIVVTVVASGVSYDATVLGSDETRDVALLQLDDASGLATVTLGDSSDVRVGDAIVALGNSTGTGDAPSVSEGTVTGVDETISVGDRANGDTERLSGLIETDAALAPGDSGGPMFNADGEVIGISTAADGGRGFPGQDRESYAVAIDSAETIADQIRSGDGSDTVQIGIRGFLGVEVDSRSDSASGIDGAVIAGVLDGTPAEGAGLQAGDVITGIDGERIDSGDGLSAGLHGFRPGDEVTVDWTDASGASRSATVTLTTGPA